MDKNIQEIKMAAMMDVVDAINILGKHKKKGTHAFAIVDGIKLDNMEFKDGQELHDFYDQEKERIAKLQESLKSEINKLTILRESRDVSSMSPADYKEEEHMTEGISKLARELVEARHGMSEAEKTNFYKEISAMTQSASVAARSAEEASGHSGMADTYGQLVLAISGDTWEDYQKMKEPPLSGIGIDR